MQFHTPEGLESIFLARVQNVSESEFIRKPQHKDLKEMWCAFRFGLGYERFIGPCLVTAELEENSDSDFVVRIASGDFPFQTCIADDPERRMGDDYIPGPDGNLPTRPYQPERGRIEGPRWVETAVKGKVAKRYSTAKQLNLLVYANFNAYLLEYDALREAVEKYKDEFASIWVITNHQICSLTLGSELGEICGLRVVYSPDSID